jgi:hypothetical protein
MFMPVNMRTTVMITVATRPAVKARVQLNRAGAFEISTASLIGEIPPPENDERDSDLIALARRPQAIGLGGGRGILHRPHEADQHDFQIAARPRRFIDQRTEIRPAKMIAELFGRALLALPVTAFRRATELEIIAP